MKNLFLIIILSFVFCSFDCPEMRNINDTIEAKSFLLLGEKIVSQNGIFQFKLYKDGNMILENLESGVKIWESKTQNKDAYKLKLNMKGNLKLIRKNNSTIWETETDGSGKNNYLRINNDGSLVLYVDELTPIWAINQGGPPPEPTGDPGIAVVGYKNYYKKGNNISIEFSGLPENVKIGDVIQLIVISDKPIKTNSDWIFIKSQPYDGAFFQIYYQIVLNPNANILNTIGPANGILATLVHFRGVIK